MRLETFFFRTTAFKKVLSLIILLFFGEVAAAATMKIVELPATGTDKAIDISSDKIYTHTFDFGLNDAVTINGVAFERVVEGIEIKGIDLFEDTSSQGYRYSLLDSRWFLTNPNYKFWLKNHAGGNEIDNYCDGKSRDLFNDFLYHDRSATHMGEGIIVTLKDLKPAERYSVRYYYRSWDPPLPRPLTIYGDGESNGTFKDSISVDIDIGRLGAQYIDYSFVSDDSDVVVKFLFHSEGQGPHLYGLTCEKMPETDINGRSKPLNKSLLAEFGQICINPSDRNIRMQFHILKAGPVSISIHNLAGKLAAVLVDGKKEAGTYSVHVDGSHLKPGVYVCTMTGLDKFLSNRLLLIK